MALAKIQVTVEDDDYLESRRIRSALKGAVAILDKHEGLRASRLMVDTKPETARRYPATRIRFTLAGGL